MNKIWPYIFLTKGDTSTRSALLASYIVLISYGALLVVFFSIPPGPSSTMIARMDRALFGIGILITGTLGIAIVIWLAGVATYIRSVFSLRMLHIKRLGILTMPILTVIVMASIYNGFLNGHGTAIHKYIYELPKHIGVVGQGREPTPAQLEIVNLLIQEQIDIPYKEPNFDAAKDILLKNGETVKEATERNKKLHTKIHNFLVALKNKPYKNKKEWAINYLELTIDLGESAIKSLEKPLDKSDKGNKEVILFYAQRKEWLAILKE